jgi:hypothetical protein
MKYSIFLEENEYWHPLIILPMANTTPDKYGIFNNNSIPPHPSKTSSEL